MLECELLLYSNPPGIRPSIFSFHYWSYSLDNTSIIKVDARLRGYEEGVCKPEVCPPGSQRNYLSHWSSLIGNIGN